MEKVPIEANPVLKLWITERGELILDDRIPPVGMYYDTTAVENPRVVDRNDLRLALEKAQKRLVNRD